MKILTAVSAAAAMSLIAGLAQARDISPDEAQKLVQAGTIKSVEQLNAAALAKYPGAQVEDSDLEQKLGRYVYEVEVRDAQGVQWDLDLDAATAEIIKTERDD
ncbi:PepSY domain-containing protein [Pseudomonas sp. 5P_3.1_Bac2]|uniref:PepSY domain-containing protein n=1 Tax=Pseudomonas sp. 5P_3.1_Bac2 TaxID=2971617 RepID=UPI0021C84507|nr:PepSY domain-containing protein [Pseudomonas sp. 5P_3.1_Bac2]MCU1717018.1 PepSY domain-containing protein [Pseudomonas sp. 5P_3.1_Bac2]